jgi:hypothetical protein
MQPRTAQQIADAAAKRRATQAANKAQGLPTVRQARAAAKAAKAGQTYTPPAPKVKTAPNPYGGSRRRRRSRFNSGYAPPPPVQSGPVFTAPKPDARALKLVALVALEAAFIAKVTATGATDELRHSYAKYKAVKTRALSPATGSSPDLIRCSQNEADAALCVATIALVKLCY